MEPVASVEEVEPLAVEFVFELGGWPLGGAGMDIPIWLSASMMLCINLSLPPCCDAAPETWVSEVAPPLLDCSSMER